MDGAQGGGRGGCGRGPNTLSCIQDLGRFHVQSGYRHFVTLVLGARRCAMARLIQYKEMSSGPDFTLIGFSQEGSIRHFAFQGRNDDQDHRDFTVDADTNLIRRYGISLQELPLLCRRVLEETLPLTPGCALIFGEERMQRHAYQREASERIAQDKKRPPRKPNSDNLGQAWRGPSF